MQKVKPVLNATMFVSLKLSLKSSTRFEKKIALQSPIKYSAVSRYFFTICTMYSQAAGSVLAKYNTDGYGQVCAKYSTDGPVVGEYSLNGILAENVDVTAGYSVNTADSFQAFKLQSKFHNSLLNATGSMSKSFFHIFVFDIVTNKRGIYNFCAGIIFILQNLFRGELLHKLID